MNGDLLYSVPQFYGNNRAVIGVTRQYRHQQLEWRCSTAWPFWYMKGVFMYSWDTKISCMSKSTLHTWRADQDKTATVYFQSGSCQYCMFCTVLLNTHANTVMW